MNADDLLQIQASTEKRCTYIANNQKKFINSLLGREHKSIVLNRIRKFDEQDREILIVDEDEVKVKAVIYYSKQFRKRLHKFNNPITEEWKEIYKPQRDINEEWYSGIGNIPDECEWKEVLKSM